MRMIAILLIQLTYCTTSAFLVPNSNPHLSSASSRLFASNRKSSYVEEEAAVRELEEKGAGVVGATFFGGNKQKEELFDEIAEANANVELSSTITYNKWTDTRAFPDSKAQAVAKSIQGQLNALIYTEEREPDFMEYSYASNVDWQSPLSQTDAAHATPFSELQKSLDFYNRLDVAITSGQSIDASQVELRWEISVVWPNFWEGRALLTGTSMLTINDMRQIVKQVDTLDDNNDLNGRLVSQVQPRFWDVYHIGMTPSAELSPKFPGKTPGLFSSYKLYTLPPRLVYSPSLLDSGSRDDAAAATVPNHAFCDFIKTMGPRRQRYVPTSPLEVVVSRQDDDTDDDNKKQKQRLIFSMPISVELQTNPVLPYPGDDPETSLDLEPLVEYKWQDARLVATMPYAGSPQDEQIASVRKRLYEEVVTQSGLRPKLDKTTGRPQFFFWSNSVKACYTETGLGMAVYEYRGKWARSNEVGIELELIDTIDIVKR